MNTSVKYILLACIAIHAVTASNKVVVYWGQNSVGNEGSLRDYCTSPSVDIVVIGFVYEFPKSSYAGSSYPGLNFANHCWKTFDAANPYFLDCADSIGADITYCQSLGKQVLLSFGGAVGTYGFSSDSQAQDFATTTWNMFLGGSGVPRPFGNATVDGIDLDIEAGGSRGYAAFVTKLRTYFTAQSARTYYISGAPQCVYPDAMMGPGVGTALGEAWFDYVWVQFYNNYCGINYYPGDFNFNVWANWAASSKNPNVQVFIGAPGDQNSAGQGYVTAATLKIISTAVSATYPSNYGGVMLWDAGTALSNGDFAAQMAAFLHTASTATGVISTPTTPPVSTPSTTSVITSASLTTSVVKSTPLTTAAVKSTPLTTSAVKSTVATTGATVATTGAARIATTGRTKTPVASSTSSTSSSSAQSNTCSTAAEGYMRCAGASSYQTCSHGLWSVVQNCATPLKCSPSGNYIYCVW